MTALAKQTLKFAMLASLLAGLSACAVPATQHLNAIDYSYSPHTAVVSSNEMSIEDF